MNAVKYLGTDEGIGLVDVPAPTVAPDEVLIKMRAASICGSDLRYQMGTFSPPAGTQPILGHEGAGVVVETGEDVDCFDNGDRVAVHYVISCGACKPCLQGRDNSCRRRESIGHDRDGTFAEYIAVPSQNAVKMGSDIPFEWGSIVGCASSTAYHAVRRANMTPGDTVVVFGVGGVGLSTVLWANNFGAGRIIAVDLIDPKLDAACACGADLAINAATESPVSAVMEETDGWGVDVAFECSGTPAGMKQSLATVDGKNRYDSGTVVAVGLQHESFEVEYWGLREGGLILVGDHTRREIREVFELLEADTVDLSPLLGLSIPLERIHYGFDCTADTEGPVGRVILDPTRE